MKKKLMTVIMAAAMALTGAMAFPVSCTVEAQAASAQEAKVNEPVHIDMDKADDSGYFTDEYSFKMPGNGYSTVDIFSADHSKNLHVGVKIMDEDHNVLFDEQVYEDTTIGRDGFAVTEGRTYYVTFSAVAYRFDSKEMDLTWHYTQADGWESENNDKSGNANLLKEGKNISGTIGIAEVKYITDYQDVDYFKFKVTKNWADVTIKFGPADINDNDAGWSVDLLNDNGEESTIMENVKSKQNLLYHLKRGTYYTKVYKGLGARKYDLSYSTSALKVKTPKVKKLSGYTYKSVFNGRQAEMDKVILSGAGNVDGYRVQIAKQKNMKGLLYSKLVKPSPKNTLTLNASAAFKKSKVYVQVRPYVTDPFGHNIFGKKSGIKGVTLKARK